MSSDIATAYTKSSVTTSHLSCPSRASVRLSPCSTSYMATILSRPPTTTCAVRERARGVRGKHSREA